jgi:hypothetical protein
VKVTENDTKATKELDGRLWRDALPIHECPSIRHSLDGDDPVLVVEDAVIGENVGSGELDLRGRTIETAGDCDTGF